jgi:hypothetical protein
MILTRENPRGLKFTLCEVEGKTRVHCLTVNKTITVNQPLETMNQSWYRWTMRGDFVQDAFRFLNADEREFLMTGITGEEWNELFPEDDDEIKGDNNGPAN